MIHAVTFSYPNMDRSALLCLESAKKHGADTAVGWTDCQLRSTEFYLRNRETLDAPRAGYWLWKPFIIDVELGKMADGEYLCYSDAGVEFINNLRYITDRMTSDVWLFGNQYQHAHWCKRDIFEAIWPGAPWESFVKQCQASVIFIRNSKYSRKFVKEWLDFCTVKHLIDDSPSIAPNHPEFQENRHDQAILTTLAYKYGIGLHWWGAVYNNGAFTYSKDGYESDDYPPVVHHHRKRNHEWENAA